MSLTHRLFSILCGVLLVSCAPAPKPTETSIPQPKPVPESTAPAPTTPQPTVPTKPEKGQVLPITATAKVVSSGKIFQLEVTQTEEQQELGLMYRESLPDDRGMLFDFNPPSSVRFWMKDCRMNLDMIFLRNGVIKAIARNAPPCEKQPCPTYGTPAEIDQVIEIRGGLADEIGLKEGEKIIVTPL